MNKKGKISLFRWVKFFIGCIFWQGVGLIISMTFIEIVDNAFPTGESILVNFIKVSTIGITQFNVILIFFYIYPNKGEFYK